MQNGQRVPVTNQAHAPIVENYGAVRENLEMSDNTKKYLKIAGGVLAVVAVGALIYMMMKKKKPAAQFGFRFY